MSNFLSRRFLNLEPYTPGEQPKIDNLIKLNTNESPFPPSDKAIKKAGEAAKRLRLYPDPECSALTEAIAKKLGVEKDEVLLTNGSDEILNFAFMAFCDNNVGAAFADITYGFYEVFAQLYGIPYTKIPLDESFNIRTSDYFNIGKTIFIANPNAPTGIYLSTEQIEQILLANPDNVVVIDEAYVDFGNESCVPLIKKYNNLLVTQTFSKSRSMAGARLGFGVGCSELIRDLNTIKYSTNPYNINSLTMAAGLGSVEDNEYFERNCRTICETREKTKTALAQMGFEVTDSKANFIFVRHKNVSGEEIYNELRKRSILVRHFSKERIADFNRITIGTAEQMNILIKGLEDILK